MEFCNPCQPHEPLQDFPTGSEFINPKINAAVMRQCRNLNFAGQLQESWPVSLVRDCPFLFAPSTRQFLFDTAFCGSQRAIQRIQEHLADSADGGDRSRIHRVPRKKLRVWRQRVLECAKRVVEVHGKNRSMFDFEFFGEVGSGLGPTQEFYVLLQAELRKRALGLWRVSDEPEGAELLQSPFGLYILPRSDTVPLSTEVLSEYKFVGHMLARALLDRRPLNLRLSLPLLKQLRGQVMVLEDIRFISEPLYCTLAAIHRAARDHTDAVTVAPGKTVKIADMALSFSMPGEHSFPLMRGGDDVDVTAANMEEYVHLVCEHLLHRGIAAQVEAMRQGFQQLVSLTALHVLSLEELFEAFSGHADPVKVEDLDAFVVCDHGFTNSSQPVRWLFQVIEEMEPKVQQRFFQFLTGSPMLPVGGLKSLRPKFTVVRKTADDTRASERDLLPSAMTCVNYLKLPAYPSKEMLREKLLVAIEEGCGAFLLT